MSKTVLKDAAIFLGGYDASGDQNTVALTHEADTPEATAFNNDTHAMLPNSLATIGMSSDGFWQAAEPDKSYFDNMGDLVQDVLVGNGKTAGSRAYSFQGFLSSYTPLSGDSIGDPHTLSLDVAARDKLIRGLLMTDLASRNSDGNGSAQQLGTVSSSESLYLAAFVTSVSGQLPNITLVAEGDNDTNFGDNDEVDVLSLSLNGAGSARTSKSGSLSYTHYRVRWNIDGADPPRGAIAGASIAGGPIAGGSPSTISESFKFLAFLGVA